MYSVKYILTLVYVLALPPLTAIIKNRNNTVNLVHSDLRKTRFVLSVSRRPEMDEHEGLGIHGV